MALAITGITGMLGAACGTRAATRAGSGPSASHQQPGSTAGCNLFAEAGGNFVDTANNYTNGSAETIVGRLLAGERDRFVLATKYALSTRTGDLNAGGDHRKNLVQALEASLRRLGTDYVDVLWLHAWDYLTPAEEVVRALDDQVRAGKVLYVGVSDTPAWVVAQMQAIARLRGWTPFIGLQIPYSLVQREVERELVPMARALGLGVTAWSPLGGGLLTGKYNRQGGDQTRRLGAVDPAKLEIAQTVTDLAADLGVPPSNVALAWLRSRGGVIPILGARTAEQLLGNLGCLDVHPERRAAGTARCRKRRPARVPARLPREPRLHPQRPPGPARPAPNRLEIGR